jgi:integron integrase
VAAAVHICTRGGHIELRFDPGFTPVDVAAVRAVPGREWHRGQLAWVLPDTPATQHALERSFGQRLVRSDQPATANQADPPARDAILQRLREAIRIRNYSLKTERAYLGWAGRFLRFHAHAGDEPLDLDATHARAFLEHLATTERLAAKSRNQAASALGFMFREVFGNDVMAGIPRAKGPARVPLVLSHGEVLRVLRELVGKYFLIVVLLYSAGLRIEECLRLRVKDIDFELRQILIRDGKGKKDRYVPLARRAVELLRAQIARVLAMHQKDRAAGHGWAALPGALHRKDPMAGYDAGWQFVFPASTLNEDSATKRTGHWALHVTAVQRQVKRAVRHSGITKRATCHTFRHSFATEALRGGCDIRTLQHVMGHKDIRTTMIYLHVLEQTGFHMRSPLDRADDPEVYEPDGIGRPWEGMEQPWELAAKQWDPASRRGRPDAVHFVEGSNRTDPKQQGGTRRTPPGRQPPHGPDGPRAPVDADPQPPDTRATGA